MGLDVVVDSQDPLARSGLLALLRGAGLHPVDRGEAAVALFDLGADAQAGLRRLEDQLPLLPRVLALVPDERAAGSSVHAGAQGALLRDATEAELVAALHAVAAGLRVVDGHFQPGVLSSPPPLAHPADALTPRERQVVELLSRGLSNKEIAAALDISEHTAKFHVNSILGKLGADGRTDAVVRAARLGWVTL